MFPKIKIKKIITTAALFTIVSFIILIPFTAFAADEGEKPVPFKQNIQIGNKENVTQGMIENGTGIGEYLRSIYRYAIGAVGILATVVMMFGGVIWITSAGNNERVSDAKAWIGASITGLVLALSSYTILYLVNPNVLNFRPIELKKPDKIEEAVNLIGCCRRPTGTCENVDEDNCYYTSLLKTPNLSAQDKQTLESQKGVYFNSNEICRKIDNLRNCYDKNFCISDSECPDCYADIKHCNLSGKCECLINPMP